MPDFDALARQHLNTQSVNKPTFFAWFDILDDPIRATTYGANVTLAGTGDPELDGDYSSIDSRLVNIGAVTQREGGSDTVTCTLSGLLLPDQELLDAISDKANWDGRIARLWVQVRDENHAPRGAIAPYYTGYMTSLEIVPGRDAQVIRLQIDNYLTLLTQPFNRTYLSQAEYDPGDFSARATIGSANGSKGGPAGSVPGSYGGGGDGGGGGRGIYVRAHIQ